MKGDIIAEFGRVMESTGERRLPRVGDWYRTHDDEQIVVKAFHTYTSWPWPTLPEIFVDATAALEEQWK